MAALLETEVLEYWADRVGGGRAGGCTGGRASPVFHKTSSEYCLAAGSVEYWVLSWKRRLLSGCSLGDAGS